VARMTSSMETGEVGNCGREAGALGIFERLRSRVMRPLPTLSTPFRFGAFENPHVAFCEHGTTAAAKFGVDRHAPRVSTRPAFRLSFAPNTLARETVDGPNSPDVTAQGIIRRARVAAPGNGAGAVPERRLMLAVLEDALAILLSYSNSRTRSDRGTVGEVRAWLAMDDSKWPFSFLNICDVLDLSALRIRSALAQATDYQARHVVATVRAS